MTRSPPDEIEFVAWDDAAVLSRMRAMAMSGTGWVNIRPIIDREDEPPPPGVFAIFGGSAHKVPTATWLPGPPGAGGSSKPTTIGLQHGSGPRVVRRLHELGLPLPDGWRVTQDHPRRGLVAQAPPGAAEADALAWLVQAAAAVCAVPSTGRWRAEIHTGTA